MATVLFPLPDQGFDVTEVSVPWKLLVRAGHRVLFATERGQRAQADPLLLDRSFPLGSLAAWPEPILFYRELEQDPAFLDPLPWDRVELGATDALWLAGGHAPPMRQYLGSELVQRLVAEAFARKMPVASICHGALLAARALDPSTGRSVLHGRRTTALPRYLERTAYWLTAWKLGRHYRTYPAYVEDEVRAALADPSHFERGPFVLTARGTDEDDGPAFVVEDGPYLSARWPGDAYLLTKRLLTRLSAPGMGRGPGSL
jgi:putative intracellular protease/amidase